MEKFNRVKKPRKLDLSQSHIDGSLYLGESSQAAVIEIGLGKIKIGPRKAVKIAEWLMQYAKYSSLKDQ
jgi:hypothetical protein